MTDFYDVELSYSQEDTHALESPISIVTLILPPEVTTVNNPRDSTSDSGVTVGVTVEQQKERWLSKMEPQTQLQSLNARIQGY